MKSPNQAGGKEVLDKIYGVLAKVENEIVVKNHTDNIPISTTEFKLIGNFQLQGLQVL